MTRCARVATVAATAACLAVLATLCSPAPVAGHEGGPMIATQFSATVTITAHLVDRTKEYPPWLRKIGVVYDYDNRRARADLLEGYEAGRLYLRRYDQKKEYMVKDGEFAECQRAYLGEEMPEPRLPHSATMVGMEVVGGIECEHWVDEAFESRVHTYIEAQHKAPIKVVDTTVLEDGSEEKIMTYEYDNIELGAVDEDLFVLPEPYTHKSCERNVGGFPYLHVFHYYLRF